MTTTPRLTGLRPKQPRKAPGAPPGGWPARRDRTRAQIEALLRIVTDAAAKGLPAPTNRALATAIGASSDDRAGQLLAQLEAEGRLRIERRTLQERRIILSCGAATGWTEGAPRPRLQPVRQRREDGSAQPMGVPEIALARAVIAQALADAAAAEVSRGGRTDPARPTEADRTEAREFLLAEDGRWAAAREALCGLALLEASAVRDAARRRIGAATRGASA